MVEGQKVAYVRVSTVEQNEARQVEALKSYGLDRTFIEKASGKDTNRPYLQEMLDYVRAGDTVYILDFSRLARSTRDLLEIVEQLEVKGVKLISLKENLDTHTPAGKMMLTMLAAINQFERENILERQREGIILAKRAGKYKGRKRIAPPTNFEDVFIRWEKRELTGKEAMKELKLKPNTFYKILTEWRTKEGLMQHG